MPNPPYILLGSAPLAPIALRELKKANYLPVEVIDDPKLGTDGILEVIDRTHPHFLLIASYGAILKPIVLERVRNRCLNIHPSLLPLYRGPSPVVQTILDGAKETGVTIIEIDAKMDHGPIIAQEKVRLKGDEVPSDLYEKLTTLGVKLFLENVEAYLGGKAKLHRQDDEAATFCHFIKKEQGLLNLSDPADVNERKIRAFQGWPGTWIMYQDKRLFIRKAHLKGGHLVIDRVQPESRKEMSLKEFCAGIRIKTDEFYQALRIA